MEGGECFTECEASSPLERRVLSKPLKMLSPCPWKMIFVFMQWVSPTYYFIQRRVWLKWCERLCAGDLHKDNFMCNSVLSFYWFHIPPEWVWLSSSTERNWSAKRTCGFPWDDPKLVFFLTEENKDTLYLKSDLEWDFSKYFVTKAARSDQLSVCWRDERSSVRELPGLQMWSSLTYIQSLHCLTED